MKERSNANLNLESNPNFYENKQFALYVDI
jgi:hypothetical protein